MVLLLACVLVSETCGASIAYIVSTHDSFGAPDDDSLRAMLAPGAQSADLERALAAGRIVKLRAGSRVSFIEMRTFTPHGLVAPIPNRGDHPRVVDVDRVRIMDGPLKGLDVWVLAADVRFGTFPMP